MIFYYKPSILGYPEPPKCLWEAYIISALFATCIDVLANSWLDANPRDCCWAEPLEIWTGKSLLNGGYQMLVGGVSNCIYSNNMSMIYILCTYCTISDIIFYIRWFFHFLYLPSPCCLDEASPNGSFKQVGWYYADLDLRWLDPRIVCFRRDHPNIPMFGTKSWGFLRLSYQNFP